METEPFRAGVDELLADPARGETCSESLWWRCHRRLPADYLVLVRGVAVSHVMHNRRLRPHPPTTDVRVVDGALIYDVGVTPPLPDA